MACPGLTKQYNRMELKTFLDVIFLVSKPFSLKIKTKFEITMVTFHPKLSASNFFDITDKERYS